MDYGEQLYVKYFNELSNHRTINNHIVAPIMYTEMLAYFELKNYYYDEDVIYWLEEMDKVYIEIKSRQIKLELERIVRERQRNMQRPATR